MIPTPQSELYLLSNVELDPDYNYTIDFANKDEQQQYFQSKINNTFFKNEGYSFLRVDNSIKVQANVEDLDGINYIMFKNADRWHYAFILKKEYINPSTTRLIIKYDTFQTFMFDYKVGESFVSREHQDRWNADKPILNTTPENLEVGNSYNKVSGGNYSDPTITWYLVKCKEELAKWSLWSETLNFKWNMLGSTVDINNRITDNKREESNLFCYLIPSKGDYLHFKNLRTGDEYTYSNYNIDGTRALHALSKDTRVISITPLRRTFNNLKVDGSNVNFTMFEGKDDPNIKYDAVDVRPVSFPITEDGNTYNDLLLAVINIDTGINYSIEKIHATKPTSQTEKASITHEPKLDTFPYHFLRINFYGNVKDFHVEDFDRTKDNAEWLHICSLDGDGNLYFVPKDHNGKEYDDTQMLTARPNNMDLRTDKWLEYKLNNKASLNGGLITTGVQMVGGLALGAMTGGIGLAVAGSQVLNFGGQIANEMLKRQDIQQMPDDLRLSSFDTLGHHAINGGNIFIEHYQIKEEYRNKIYKYFMHYGYLCNEFKIPDLRSRYYFNYIKTIGVNIITNIDAEYKTEIASIYDKGITIWHYRNGEVKVNNYEFENAEMSIL